MKRIILLCAVLLAACGSESGSSGQPSGGEAAPAPAPVQPEPLPPEVAREKAAASVQKRLERAVVDSARRASEDQAQAPATQDGATQP